MEPQKKRIAVAPAPPGASAPATQNAKANAPRKPIRTLRLALHLSQSNERECPEFNYKELVSAEESKRRAEKEKRKGNGANGIWDAFSDNDEDVERIAKKFEQKYGSSSTYGRSKGRSKQDNYADIGAGYDENDSFIDNTDAYDEIMPPECDTVWGGFYINSGSLEFQNVPGTGLSTGEGAGGDSTPPAERKSLKRPLSSSDSEEESSSSEDDTEGSVVEKPIQQSVKDSKTSSVTDDKSGEDGKQSKSEKVNGPRKKRKNSQEGSASSGQESSANQKNTKPSVENTPNGLENHNDGSSDSRSSVVPSSDNHASSDSSREANTAPVPINTPVVPSTNILPPDLPHEIISLIQRLKALADLFFASRTGKLSGPEVNEIILGMELQCRRNKLPPRVRHSLYGHAALLLRRGKAGLLQQARRIAEDHQRNTSTLSPIDKLKEVIDKMKPSLLETYKTESQKIVEINKQIATQNALLDEDKKIQEKRLPKRRFPWNDNVRSILQDVVHSRGLDSNDNNNEEIIKFLQSVILPLFPSGFVRMPTLLQQVRNAKTQKAAIDGNPAKKVVNKSLEIKSTGNSQMVANKTTMKSTNDCKNDTTKNISDSENASVGQTKTKVQISSSSTNTDLPDHRESSKTIDQLSQKSESKVESEKIRENGNDIDKNKQMKTFNENMSSLQAISDNISISISVYSKKTDSGNTVVSSPTVDKHNQLDSVIIKPSDKYVQQHSKINESSVSLNNANSVIKTVESLTPNISISQNQPLVGSLKVKPTSSLLGKSTIAKIISSKNTSIDINKYTGNDGSMSKAFNELQNKQIQDSSNLKRFKSANLAPLSDSNSMQLHANNNMAKTTNNQVLKPVNVVLTDNFAKPHFKTDHSVHSNKVSHSSINSNIQSKYKDNFHANKKDNHQNNLNLNEHNHSFIKPNVLKPADFLNVSPVSDKITNQKHSGIIKHAEHDSSVQNLISKLNNANVDLKQISNSVISSPKTSAIQKNAILNLDDSSSDDCVEIVDDDDVNKPSVPKVIDNRQELIRRQMQINEKYLKNKVHNMEASKIKREKWISSSNMSVSNVPIQNENLKKMSNLLKINEPDIKKVKHDTSGVEIVVEEDPLRDVSDHIFNNSSSVIKDVSSKSDRLMDTMPNDSGILQYEKDFNDRDAMNQDDFNKVMQDLKELQDFQLRSDGNHRRLYEDPSNNICHTSYSETENKIYIHKEARENM